MSGAPTDPGPNSRSPEFEALAARLRARPFNADTTPIDELRAGFERFAASFSDPPQTELEAVDADTVPAEWSRPPGDRSEAAVLYLHGGGYAIGSIEGYRDLAARIAVGADLSVLTVGYRLAPEHRYPAALDDAVAAYRWLAKTVHPSRIIVAGDSAGGGLTAALALALRDTGDTLPRALVLISGLLDLAHTGASVQRNADLDPIVTPAGSHAYATRYLGPEEEHDREPLASPLYGDLAGLPPTLVLVGTAECLLDDSLRFARRAKAAGVDVELDVWPDMFHIMPFFASQVPEAAEALAAVVRFIRRHLSS